MLAITGASQLQMRTTVPFSTLTGAEHCLHVYVVMIMSPLHQGHQQRIEVEFRLQLQVKRKGPQHIKQFQHQMKQSQSLRE
jgi:hypothetical protein